MAKLPSSENALLIRTDFTDPNAWEHLTSIVQEPSDLFIFNMEVVDDASFSGKSVQDLVSSLPVDYPHSFIAVVDSIAISKDDHPVLLVDVEEEPGRSFRSIASQVPSIDNNLSISNMGFEEFLELVDENGVFRGLGDI